MSGACSEACEHEKKAKWPVGPWTTEPDRVDFRHAGLPCILHRGFLGAWCGYAGVPPGHRWMCRLTLANGIAIGRLVGGARKAGRRTLLPEAKHEARALGLKLIRGCPVYLSGERV